MEQSKTLYLVDGTAYIYRGFFAMPHLSNSSGLPTNAILSFVNMLKKFINEMNPKNLAVAFDRKEETFRHEEYEEYKANRAEMPDELIPQIPYIKKIVELMNIKILEKAGYEADDLIATAAKRAEAAGYDVVIVSADKDLMQIINDKIKMYDPMRDRWYDKDAVEKKFGVPPEKVRDVMALMGDTSDNIPGVPGIGPKTAAKLICEYGSLDNLLQNIDSVKNKKLKERLRDHYDDALLSKNLVTLDCDAPLDYDIDDLKKEEPDKEGLTKIFRELEFKSQLQLL
ncbi:MAG: hypothetical protein D6734_00955 [Candidatus Schekmanbacteria bacterium]|nr:MAG: hypothetical protein D6734_00955 [Candidatus Schekmanbacteria bacterium]